MKRSQDVLHNREFREMQRLSNNCNNHISVDVIFTNNIPTGVVITKIINDKKIIEKYKKTLDSSQQYYKPIVSCKKYYNNGFLFQKNQSYKCEKSWIRVLRFNDRIPRKK